MSIDVVFFVFAISIILTSYTDFKLRNKKMNHYLMIDYIVIVIQLISIFICLIFFNDNSRMSILFRYITLIAVFLAIVLNIRKLYFLNKRTKS